MNVSGTLDASAPNGGNGGFIETSATHVKIADDVKITTAAPDGNAGTWLIDPTDYTIAAVDPLNGSSCRFPRGSDPGSGIISIEN